MVRHIAPASFLDTVSLFKSPLEDNVRKRWNDFVKRSYCGEFKITTNTHLGSVHFTPDSYSNCHQVKYLYLNSLLMLVSGAEPTLPVPSLHPSVPPTAGATITATCIMCHHHGLRARHQLVSSHPADSG